MSTQPGLRERKKQRTRALIAEVAWRLFSERGFDRVTVAEVAREADVSEATVFNYFPTKEDLLYDRMEAFQETLLRGIRERPASESILSAFGRLVLEPRGSLASDDAEAAQDLARITRVITESASLLARERELFESCTDTLATLLAQEMGRPADDIEPWVAANALIGVHRALLDSVRREVLAGARNPLLARQVRARGKRALVLLEHGLGREAASRARHP